MLAGCNPVLGIEATTLAPDADLRPDLDHDGIADVDDPCIASQDDIDEDFDGDGIPNGTDPCPYGQLGDDMDGDGIPNLCDPFETTAGDRMRCVMRFRSLELDATLWEARTGDMPFAIAQGYLLAFGPQQSMVATERVLPDSPTITIEVVAQTLAAAQPFELGLWLSAAPTPSAQDVGCKIAGDATKITIGVTGPNPTISSPGPPPASSEGLFIIRAILQPSSGGMNLLCIATNGQSTVGTRSSIAAPLGAFGFAAGTGGMRVMNVAIYDRDDAPLP